MVFPERKTKRLAAYDITSAHLVPLFMRSCRYPEVDRVSEASLILANFYGTIQQRLPEEVRKRGSSTAITPLPLFQGFWQPL